jgi:hypothetical protein
MWGRSAINSDSTMNSYEQSQPNKEVRNIKDVLSAYRYHTIPAIRQILLTQRNRVSDMFDAIEDEMVRVQLSYQTGGRRPVNIVPYVKIGLKTQWDTWSSGRLSLAKSKAETYMSHYLQSLQNGYATPALRNAAQAAAGKGDNDPQTLIDKIDALATAVGNLPAWNAPF